MVYFNLLLVVYIMYFFYLISSQMSSIQKERYFWPCTPHPPYTAKDIFKTSGQMFHKTLPNPLQIPCITLTCIL